MQDDEAAIRQVVGGFADAWNRHDVAAYTRLFAADADFTSVLGISAHGWDAIEGYHAPLFATQFRESHFTATDVRVRFLTPDIAAVDVRWTMHNDTDADGTPRHPREGLANLVVCKSEGRWPITVFHNMNLPKRPS